MIFATLREGGRDGTLVVVNQARTHAIRAGAGIPTLQFLLDNWDSRLAVLKELVSRFVGQDLRPYGPHIAHP
jgi:fumarylacetoacetate (FAA) hydrolase